MDDSLPISALQHFAYCPRQFALIHVEQAWVENQFTAEGRLLHERVDSGVAEQRRGVRYERNVLLRSSEYGLTGKLDLLEIQSSESGEVFTPVEYKRGKPKVESWDWIQVCAQALCIEEMKSTTVLGGAIWYWEARRREVSRIDEELRLKTIAAITRSRQIIERGETPKPTEHEKRCRACSLKDICQPERFRCDRSSSYIKKLFES